MNPSLNAMGGNAQPITAKSGTKPAGSDAAAAEGAGGLFAGLVAQESDAAVPSGLPGATLVEGAVDLPAAVPSETVDVALETASSQSDEAVAPLVVEATAEGVHADAVGTLVEGGPDMVKAQPTPGGPIQTAAAVDPAVAQSLETVAVPQQPAVPGTSTGETGVETTGTGTQAVATPVAMADGVILDAGAATSQPAVSGEISEVPKAATAKISPASGATVERPSDPSANTVPTPAIAKPETDGNPAATAADPLPVSAEITAATHAPAETQVQPAAGTPAQPAAETLSAAGADPLMVQTTSAATPVEATPRPEADAAYAAQVPLTDSANLTLKDLLPVNTTGAGNPASAMTDTAVRVTSQVQQAMTGAVLAGDEQVTLQLDPENLGRVEVRFQTQGDRLSVTIIATGAEAEKALKEGARELSDVITQRSARFQTVDVKVETREQDDRQENRQEGRRESAAKGSGREDGGGRRRSGQEPRTTAEAWADLALGG